MHTNKDKNYLIVVVGPTAIGKTALAIEIAKHYNSEIISCDSRQFYKQMNIGTAVPCDKELEAVPHHFIQNISIEDLYSVGDFEKQAIAKLDQLFEKNNIQVMVGGSGLYVKAVIQGLDDFPEIAPEIRESLNLEYKQNGLAPLQELLKELDFEHYQKVALDNPQRVIRALEVCLGTNRAYSSFLNQKSTQRNFTPILIGLTAERQAMYQRINDRVDQMIEKGLVQEVRSLLDYKDHNALQTVGYREIFEYLNQECSLDFAISEIKKNTRRFAKRQITWFNRTPNIHWFDYQSDLNPILQTIEKSMKK
ncbi:tRNA (adenosine(37)-N6)-dimethylallyltransferase MiaA [Myroides sp. LJL119]